MIWFTGDLTNFFGAAWAGLVPTVIALAVYFCFADLVLITQCLYYNVINAKKRKRQHSTTSVFSNPEQPLLRRHTSETVGLPGSRRLSSTRRSSHASRCNSLSRILEENETGAKMWGKNALSILFVCAVGVGGWFVAWKSGVWKPTANQGSDSAGSIAIGAQILGYFSAVCYLG
jgi:hypothetical protein